MTSTASLGASSARSAAHAAAFFTAFRTRLAGIEARFSTTDDGDVDALVAQLGEARRVLLDETERIPPRDRETHERALRELGDKIAAKARRKPAGEEDHDASKAPPGSSNTASSAGGGGKAPLRFAFKRSAGTNAAKAAPSSQSSSSSTAVASTAESTSASSTTTKTIAETRTASSSTATSSNNLLVEHRVKELIDLRQQRTDDSQAGASALLTIQIRHLEGCIVWVPPLEGSVMVHNCSQCLLIIERCRQYRMHDTTASTIILADCPTGATIEGCSRILFGRALSSPSDTSPHRYPVQDFDHVGSLTQSPAWRWLHDLEDDGQLSAIKERLNALSSQMGAAAGVGAASTLEDILTALATVASRAFELPS